MTTLPKSRLPAPASVAGLAMPMEVRELRCFGVDERHGNPVVVVSDGVADQQARQQFARERGKTCVFVDRSGDTGATRTLDFYYPHARSPLCLHAAVACASLLAGEAPLTARTAMHGQPLELGRSGESFSVTLQRQQAPQVDIAPARLRELLGNETLGFAGPARVASVGSPKLLVPVNDAGTLYRLQPDLAAIAAWSREHGISGIYVYWVCSEGEVEGRNFNHLDPGAEDNATGVAAGALTVLLGRGLRVCQGAAQGNPCLMVTSIAGDAVSIGGSVSAPSQGR